MLNWKVVRDICVVALFTVSVAVNIVVLRRTQAAPTDTTIYGPIAVGEKIPSLDVRRLDGSSRTINFADGTRPTILYVLAPKCAWCVRNEANIAVLADSKQSVYRVVFLALHEEGLETYARERLAGRDVFAGLSQDAKVKYHFGATPETLVLAPDGVVRKVWVGAYVPELKREIEHYFALQLPGLSEEPTTPAVGVPAAR